MLIENLKRKYKLNDFYGNESDSKCLDEAQINKSGRTKYDFRKYGRCKIDEANQLRFNKVLKKDEPC